MSCDFRGRIYGVSDFHFAREDHVRSLFRFAEGLPIIKRRLADLFEVAAVGGVDHQLASSKGIGQWD